MSNFGYVKKLRSQRSKDMKRDHTSAYLVLDSVAENAKFQEDETQHPLLDFGECIITATMCGVTKDQFPRALKYLENEGDIQVLHRGRKDENSEFMARIKRESTDAKTRINSRVNMRINGTVVKLLSSDVYEVNFIGVANQFANQVATQVRINPREIGAQTRRQEDKNTKKQQHGVVVFFDCLKEDQRLDDKMRTSLMEFTEERVKLALQYSLVVPFKKDLISLLIWHCHQQIPPPIVKTRDFKKEFKKKYKHNSIHNCATCYHMPGKIAFQRGITIHELNDLTPNYEEEAKKILETFGIKEDKI